MGEEIIRERWRLEREKGEKLIFHVLQHDQCHPMKYEVLSYFLLLGHPIESVQSGPMPRPLLKN